LGSRGEEVAIVRVDNAQAILGGAGEMEGICRSQECGGRERAERALDTLEDNGGKRQPAEGPGGAILFKFLANRAMFRGGKTLFSQLAMEGGYRLDPAQRATNNWSARRQLAHGLEARLRKIEADEVTGIKVKHLLTGGSVFGDAVGAVGTARDAIHESGKFSTRLAAGEVRRGRDAGLGNDPCDRFATIRNGNFPVARRRAHPFTGFLVKLANGNALHVTHCVTYGRERQRGESLPDNSVTGAWQAKLSQR